jgi:hypothetical protein
MTSIKRALGPLLSIDRGLVNTGSEWTPGRVLGHRHRTTRETVLPQCSQSVVREKYLNPVITWLANVADFQRLQHLH